MTVEEFLAAGCMKRGLSPNEHFIRWDYLNYLKLPDLPVISFLPGLPEYIYYLILYDLQIYILKFLFLNICVEIPAFFCLFYVIFHIMVQYIESGFTSWSSTVSFTTTSGSLHGGFPAAHFCLGPGGVLRPQWGRNATTYVRALARVLPGVPSILWFGVSETDMTECTTNPELPGLTEFPELTELPELPRLD